MVSVKLKIIVIFKNSAIIISEEIASESITMICLTEGQIYK